MKVYPSSSLLEVTSIVCSLDDFGNLVARKPLVFSRIGCAEEILQMLEVGLLAERSDQLGVGHPARRLDGGHAFHESDDAASGRYSLLQLGICTGLALGCFNLAVVSSGDVSRLRDGLPGLVFLAFAMPSATARRAATVPPS